MLSPRQKTIERKPRKNSRPLHVVRIKTAQFSAFKISKSKTVITENDHLGSVAEQLYLSLSVNFFAEALFENILISGNIQLEKNQKIASQEFQIIHIETGLRKIAPREKIVHLIQF